MAVTEGKIYLEYHDSQSQNPRTLFTLDTVEADLSTDITKQKVMPFFRDVPSLKQDDLFVVALKGNTAGTADEGSTVRIPIMRKNTATGIWTPDTLSMNDLIGFDGQANTVNIAYGTAKTPVWKYVVKAQEEIVLGQAIAENSKAYVALVLTG